ncbi:hypothetical protein [Lichenibacterium dinghuense]|uniref:hypothetical protein n=1 Tax=Lichenibacterium dinghuense TaxID=2895977 RepID=UPI001F263C93|nr:hypothetical protein [Lichenibacterium sp. 6Y81]
MTSPIRSASLVGAALLLLGASLGAAEAMPVAPMTAAGVEVSSVEPAAYLHRHYRGYHSPSARRFRHARRNSPNRYCQNQPSRCR